MAGLILGALITAFGLITLTPLNRVSFVILALGLIVALQGAARVTAGLVMRGIKAEADRRDALPTRTTTPIAPLMASPIVESRSQPPSQAGFQVVSSSTPPIVSQMPQDAPPTLVQPVSQPGAQPAMPPGESDRLN